MEVRMYSTLNKLLKKWIKKNTFVAEVKTDLRDIVYIAGPYAGNEKKNTEKAVDVGIIATKSGLAAFVPHTCIFMNVYGKDDIIEERQNGIVSTLSLMSHIASLKNSRLWVIQSEDGTYSSGTEAELIVWKDIKSTLGIPENVIIKKYSEWKKELQ